MTGWTYFYCLVLIFDNNNQEDLYLEEERLLLLQVEPISNLLFLFLTENKNNNSNNEICNTKSMQLSPWRAPGSSPVLDSCGMAGGTPAAGIILDNGTQQNKYILDNQMQQ